MPTGTRATIINTESSRTTPPPTSITLEWNPSPNIFIARVRHSVLLRPRMFSMRPQPLLLRTRKLVQQEQESLINTSMIATSLAFAFCSEVDGNGFCLIRHLALPERRPPIMLTLLISLLVGALQPGQWIPSAT